MINENYKAAKLNAFEDIHNHTFTVANTAVKKESKLFLKELLDLTSMEISYNIFKPNEEMPFFHKHKQNEEVYIIVKGSAQFIVDEQIIDLNEGSSINIKPEGERYYKNMSDSDELVFIVIQGKENTLDYDSITDGVIVE